MQITCVAGAFKGQDTVAVIYEQGLKLHEQEIFFFLLLLNCQRILQLGTQVSRLVPSG